MIIRRGMRIKVVFPQWGRQWQMIHEGFPSLITIRGEYAYSVSWSWWWWWLQFRSCDLGNNDTCYRKEIWTWKRYILILSHDKKKKTNLWRKFPPPIRRFYNTIKLLFRQYVSWYNYFWHSFCLPLFCKTKHIPPARPITRLAWLSTVCLEVPGVFVPDLWVYVTLPAIRGEGCPDWPIEGHVCWVS